MRVDRRWIWFAVSLLGLMVGLWGYDGLCRLSTVPPEIEIEKIAYPVRLSGASLPAAGIQIESADELLFRAQSLPVRTTVEIAPASGPAIRASLPPQLTRTHRALVLVSGIFFFLVNILVFCPRAGSAGEATRAFYWCTLLYGMAVLLGGPYFPRGAAWHESILNFLWISSLSVLPVLFLAMSLTFPRRLEILDRRPGILLPVWLAAAVVTVWENIAYLRYFTDPNLARWSAIALPRVVAQILLVILVLAGCAILFIRSRRLVLRSERQQMMWLLWGFTIGVAPYVFLRTVPRILGLHDPIDPAFDRLFELSIPIAFTCAVVLYRFLDIDVIIRRSLIYSFLAGAIVAVYLLIAVLAGNAIRHRYPPASPYVHVVAAVIALLLFSPTRRRIARWVDRTFFRIRYDNAQALQSLRAEAHEAPRRGDVADLLKRILKRNIEPRRICVALGADEGSRDRHGIPVDAFRAAADLARTLARPLAAPNATALPEIESPAYPAALADAGFLILAPIAEEDRCIGFVALGKKVSERRYVQEDIDLITGAASIAAATIDRIDLVRKAADEEAARHRLEEMNRLKAEFLSRVAHDLRTPLASISWSSQNLIDGVAGDPTERQMTPLRSIKASADQLNRLVTNLLEASRREIALQGSPLEPTDLASVLQETILSLTPIAAARGIRIAIEAPPESLPNVRGNKGKMMEILSNLIENACKYSPEGSTVEIALARDGSDSARLSVRDHGPGFGAGSAEHLFERFRQGEPSPYAGPTGFGLGLYVVRTLIDFMQGTVTARNHPEGGAEFVCTFPFWRDTEAEEADNPSAQGTRDPNERGQR